MNDPKVAPVQTPSEPSVWLDIADELERVAADCRNLVGEPGPRLFAIDVQPDGPDSAARAAVDAVAALLLGQTGVTCRVGAGYHRQAQGSRGPVRLSVYRSVPSPADDRQAELDRLRAEHASLAEENARLRAAAGLDHSRDDGPVDAHAGRVPPHLEDGRTGEVLDVADANRVCGCRVVDGVTYHSGLTCRARPGAS